jgi:hypothetical protein
MLKINLLTGTAWTRPIFTNGRKGDDLIALIDQYYEQYSLPVALYDVVEDNLTDEDLDEMIPINGGEYWIEGVSHVEEICGVRMLKDIPAATLGIRFDVAKGDVYSVALVDDKLVINNGQFELPLSAVGNLCEFIYEG